MFYKKYPDDSIKNLKVWVKNNFGQLTDFYQKDTFYLEDKFSLVSENTKIEKCPPSVVSSMCDAYNSGSEFDAGRVLYENFRKLTPRQASDIGFWTYLNHFDFYSFIALRWPALWGENKKVNHSSYVIDHWVQANSSQADLIEYPLSGLWWAFYLTVDETRDNKYELTEIFFKNYTLRAKLLGQASFARHKPAILAVLEFIKENKLDGSGLESAARAIIPYINLLGGIRPLTYFDKDWFKKKLAREFGGRIARGQKLFERPKHQAPSEESVKQPAAIEKNESLPNNRLLNKPKEDEERIKGQVNRWFNLNNNGEFILSEEPKPDFDWNIPIHEEDSRGQILMMYNNGKINKVEIAALLKKKLNKHYMNGCNKKHVLRQVEIIREEVLLGVFTLVNNNWWFKSISSNLLKSGNEDLKLEGYYVVKNSSFDQVRVLVMPIEEKEDVNRLRSVSSRAQGKKVSNSNYSKEWLFLYDKYGSELKKHGIDLNPWA